ncbi:type II toxin-antitoxin system PemK/MazF family toxin [Rhizobium sp. C1]|uniref:type II toxin-antitoxin system PemK/MazF family toxin n=1 Tax=Rhizobium sp. C1 TaxID=1349799 RepID=UPI001E31588A|nr:type II toxin-antitoxin system PemK/MazF family toxin [Rhizobium sp. C1]MCD2176625.1 type II toxin-antitoxin system PemK/MazF family toxin [Rhizobium sp. C1]
MSAPSGFTIMTERLVLKAGDIILVAFDPALGTEQAGTRPAIVISSDWMHGRSKRIIVCPITRNIAPWPTKIALPASMKTKGMILTDQVRSVDERARVLRVIETADAELLWAVRRYVAQLIGFGDDD